MIQKNSLENINTYAGNYGYKIHSLKYADNKTKLSFECPMGHMFVMRFNNFKTGQRCSVCAVDNRRNKRKNSIEHITNELSKENYTLADNNHQYINSKSQLFLKCNNNHIFYMTWQRFKQGIRCYQCNVKNNPDLHRTKLTYEFVQNFINKENCTLLSKEYINSKTKLHLKCKNNHEFYMDWNHFHSLKQRCPVCANRVKLNLEDLKQKVNTCGYNIISSKYSNNKQKLDFQCPEQHVFSMCWSKFNAGQRCPVCSIDVIRQKTQSSIVDIRLYVETQGFILLNNNYQNLRTKLLLQCQLNHKFKMSWGKFKNGQRCVECYKIENDSHGVKKIIEHLTQSNINFIREHRIPECKYKNTLPFDFYIPEYNCLIELHGSQHYKYCSLFGTQSDFESQQLRDQIKTQFCIDNDIPLLVIPYTDKNIPHTISEFLDNLPKDTI